VIRRKRSLNNYEAALKSPEALLEDLSLEDTGSPLKVALIDYTLSRAYCGDLSGGGDIEFMPLEDPALFTGKGKQAQKIAPSNGSVYLCLHQATTSSISTASCGNI
jgi:hypothetical protein